MPPLFLGGGPAGRLVHLTVPPFQHCSSCVGPPVASITWQYSLHDMPPTVSPTVGPARGCLSCDCASVPTPSAHGLPTGLPYLLPVLCAGAANHKRTRSSSSPWRFPAPTPPVLSVGPQVTVYRCSPVHPIYLTGTGSLASVCNVSPSVPALRLVFGPSFLIPLQRPARSLPTRALFPELPSAAVAAPGTLQP